MSRKSPAMLRCRTPSRYRGEPRRRPRGGQRRCTDHSSRRHRTYRDACRRSTRSIHKDWDSRSRCGSGWRRGPIREKRCAVRSIPRRARRAGRTGIVERGRVETTLHLLEPRALGVQTPAGIAAGLQRLPQPARHVVGDRHSGGPLQRQAKEQRVVVVVVPFPARRLFDPGWFERVLAQVDAVVGSGVVATRRGEAGFLVRRPDDIVSSSRRVTCLKRGSLAANSGT
jgi:hypothetical protein